MEISKEREDRIVAYLREYTELCRKYLMYVTGTIGADTALWDEDPSQVRTFFESDLRNKIGEMVYGGLGGPGLYADDGDHIPSEKQLNRIMDRVYEAERCGAYAEHWEKLGKPKGWLGCSLPRGHEGNHRDEEELR